MQRPYINPEHERLFLGILVQNDNKPMHYELMAELGRSEFTDLTNTTALNTLKQSIKFRCTGGEFYCLSGKY